MKKTDLERMRFYKAVAYAVVPYDPAWPQLFEGEAEKIRGVFGDLVAIEHIGSTSVPGMEGKPCVDVLILSDDLSIAEKKRGDMERLEYEYFGEFVMENSRLFKHIENKVGKTYVHIFPTKHPHVKSMIGFRDYLRSHPEAVAEYSRIKKELYAKFPEDYTSYREHKDRYVEKLLTKLGL